MSEGPTEFSQFTNGMSPAWAIAGSIIAMCVYAVAHAIIDRKKPEARQTVAAESTIGQGTPVPVWAMMGPVHEVMQTIHDMAEEARKSNVILTDICKVQRDIDRGQAYTHQLLENILRNQELREDYVPPSSSVPHHRRPQR